METRPNGWGDLFFLLLSVLIIIFISAPGSAEQAEQTEPPLVESADDSIASSEIETSFDASNEESDAETDDLKQVETEAGEGSEMSQMSSGAFSEGGGQGGEAELPVPAVIPDTMLFTGEAIAEVPIQVPPGRGGIAPDLKLVYNSYRKNGWVGVGWDLDMGAIRRSTKHGVDYGADDFVAVINGHTTELVSRSDDWGTYYYGAKVEGAFSKYYRNQSTGGWEVTTRDGTRYYYGTTSDSRQDNAYGDFKWCLDGVEDTNGNSMTITYVKDQGQIYLDEIEYTGNSGLSPSNLVKFYREGRSDAPPMHNTKALVRTAYRLKTIEVYGNGELAGKYELNYTYSTSTSRSLLTSVTRYGSDGETTLPPIGFAWQQGGDGTFHNNGSFLIQGYFPPEEDALLWMGDINGDGVADLMYFPGYFPWLTFRGNGDGTFGSQKSNWVPFGGRWRMMGDVNGDGMVDISTAYYDQSSQNPDYWGLRVTTCLSSGNGTFHNIGSFLIQGYFPPEEDAQLWMGDINGDGVADLIYFPGYFPWLTFLGNGDGTFGSQNSNWVPFGLTWRMMGDVNGDGMVDISTAYYDQSHPNQNYWGLRVTTCLSNGPYPDLITSVSNGMGGTASFEYTPSTQYDNEILPFPVYTVSSFTVDDGVDNLSTTSYAYSGGYYDAETREFRGFKYVTQTNPDDTIVWTEFHQDDYFKGREVQVDLKQQIGDFISLIAETTLTWETYPETLPEGSYAFVKLTQKRTEFYDDVTVFTQEDYTYDDTNGNLLETVTSGTDGEMVTTENLYQNFGDWLWRKTQETVTGSTTGMVRKTLYGYESGTGNMLYKERVLEGASNPMVVMTYDDYGNKITETDPRGNTTTTDYDAATHTYPVKITYPPTFFGRISHIVEYEEYDYRFGKVTREKNENGKRTYYEYDPFGRLIHVDYPDDDYPDGEQITTEYYDDDFPRYVITRVKESVGSTVDRYEYFDGLGRKIQTITFGEGGKSVVTKRFYDEMGREDLIEGPFFDTGVGYPKMHPSEYPWTETTYDSWGRPVEIKSPDGTYGTVSSTFSYSGFSTTITDPDGDQKTEKKDYLGRIIQVVEHADAGDFNTYYDYNAAGDLVTVEDDHGNTTTINYDTLGRKRNMDDPDMGYWEYTYDPNDNLLTQTDAKLQTITFIYDELNRIKSKTYSTSDPSVTYTYDNLSIPNGRGRLYSVMTSDVTKIINGYDEMGRKKSLSKTIMGDATAYTTQYEYNLAGKLTKTTYPDDYQVDYAYYPGTGLLHTVTGSDSEEYAEYTQYKPTGKIGRVDHGNGTKTTYTYDPWSTRLTGIVTQTSSSPPTDIQRRTYGYSRAGDMEEIDDELKGVVYSYTYDKLHRLLGETNGGAYDPISYEFNAIGNITSKTVGTNTFTYTYNDPAHKHAVNKITFNQTDYNYSYDLNGNMTAGHDFSDPTQVATRTIGYNADNMPTWIEHTKGGNTVRTDLVYDGDGVRAKKLVSSGSTIYYIGEHFEKKDGVAIKYIFGGDMRVAKLEGSTRYYYHKDHLGSSTAITGTIGVKVETTEYMPFGHMREHTGTVVTNYKFTDQELDPESGLYNYTARLYDPVLGRFISPDSIIPDYCDPQTLNRYSYCRNNPLIYIDPSGHFFGGIFSAIAGEIGQGLTAIGGFIGNGLNAIGGFFGFDPGGLLPPIPTETPKEVIDKIKRNNIEQDIVSDPKQKKAQETAEDAANKATDAKIEKAIKGKSKKGGEDAVQEGKPKQPTDLSKPPGKGFEWRGTGPPGSEKGSWFNEDTGEYWRNDQESPKHGPHLDYRDPSGQEWWVYPDGTWEPKP